MGSCSESYFGGSGLVERNFVRPDAAFAFGTDYGSLDVGAFANLDRSGVEIAACGGFGSVEGIIYRSVVYGREGGYDRMVCRIRSQSAVYVKNVLRIVIALILVLLDELRQTVVEAVVIAKLRLGPCDLCQGGESGEFHVLDM